jgi:hypothetical protein
VVKQNVMVTKEAAHLMVALKQKETERGRGQEQHVLFKVMPTATHFLQPNSSS